MGLPAFRGAIFAALAAVAIIFVIGALGSLIATSKSEGFNEQTYTKTKVSLWYACSRTHTERAGNSVANCFSTTDGELGCSSFKSSFRAVQAFYVMTLMLLVACFVFGLLDHFHQKRVRELPVNAKLVFILMTVVTIVFSIISFAIALAIPRTGYCDGPAFSDQDDFSHGASAFLMLIAMLIAFAMIAVSLAFPPRAIDGRPASPVSVASASHGSKVVIVRTPTTATAAPYAEALPKADPTAQQQPTHNNAPMG